jgi:hypothetical protein
MMRSVSCTILISLAAAASAEAQVTSGGTQPRFARPVGADPGLTPPSPTSLDHRDGHTRSSSRWSDWSGCRGRWRWLWRDDPWQWNGNQAPRAVAGLGACYLEPGAYNLIWVQRYRSSHAGPIAVGWKRTLIWWDGGRGYSDDGGLWSTARTSQDPGRHSFAGTRPGVDRGLSAPSRLRARSASRVARGRGITTTTTPAPAASPARLRSARTAVPAGAALPSGRPAEVKP